MVLIVLGILNMCFLLCCFFGVLSLSSCQFLRFLVYVLFMVLFFSLVVNFSITIFLLLVCD